MHKLTNRAHAHTRTLTKRGRGKRRRNSNQKHIGSRTPSRERKTVRTMQQYYFSFKFANPSSYVITKHTTSGSTTDTLPQFSRITTDIDLRPRKKKSKSRPPASLPRRKRT